MSYTNEFSELEFQILKETDKAYHVSGYVEEHVSDQVRQWKFWVPKSQCQVVSVRNQDKSKEPEFRVLPKNWVLQKQIENAADYFNVGESTLHLLDSFQDQSISLLDFKMNR